MIIPRIPTFSDLQNPELMIQNMQTILGRELSWLEYSFGLAEVLKKEDTTYPAFYISNNDPINLLPDDNMKSYSFFIRGKDSITYVKGENTSPIMRGRNEETLSIIVYCDMKRINTSLTDYTVIASNIRRDLINVIQTKMIGIGQGGFTIDTIIEEPEKVFDEFTLESVPVNLYTYPIKCFRINGTLMYWDICNSVSIA